MNIRLNKYISDSGFCSRRQADQLVEEGRVTINDQIAQIGDMVAPKDRVKIDGETLTVAIDDEKYILLYKPAGVRSVVDPTQENTLADLIPITLKVHCLTVLDHDSEGAVLLAPKNDTMKMLQAMSDLVEKEYSFTVTKPLEDDFQTKLGKLIPEIGVHRAKAKITLANAYQFKVVVLKEEARQLRNACEKLGYPIRRLVRSRIGTAQLKSLDPGEWREITKSELSVLTGKGRPKVVVDLSELAAKKAAEKEKKKDAKPEEFVKGAPRKNKPTPKGKGTGLRVGKSRVPKLQEETTKGHYRSRLAATEAKKNNKNKKR